MMMIHNQLDNWASHPGTPRCTKRNNTVHQMSQIILCAALVSLSYSSRGHSCYCYVIVR